MALQVVNGARLSCSFGTTPAVLTVTPANRTTSNNQPHATIMDHAPALNITPFGMCQTPSNPQVAAATSAAMGVLTPQPCIPATQTPWAPGSINIQIGGLIMLNDTSKCACMWGGVISVTSAGQTQTELP